MNRTETVQAINAHAPVTLDVLIQDPSGKVWVIASVEKTKRFKMPDGSWSFKGDAEKTLTDCILIRAAQKPVT